MKRVSVFLICIFTLLLYSCPELAPGVSFGDDNWNLSGKTTVRFVNNNSFPVEIYSDPSRQNRIAYVEQRSVSAAVDWSVNKTGASFYPTYLILFEGVVSIPYEGEVIIARVDEGKNNVRIHVLSQLGSEEKEKLISTDTYVVIINASSYAMSLRQGASELFVEETSSPILNGGESGAFLITPGPVSGFSVMRNTTVPLDFPAHLMETDFGFAKLYSFRYNGGDKLLLHVIKNLTIADALRY